MTRETLRACIIAASIFVLCVGIIVLGVFTAPKAKAGDGDGYGGGTEYHWDWSFGTGDPHRRHRRFHRHHTYQPPVYAYERRDGDEGRHFEIESRHERCLDHHEDTVSTEHLEPNEAMISATKLWSARVNWLWGARWMNWDNAADKKVVCDQSNAMDTLSGRIIDNAQKLIGNDGKNQRCFISAIPCAASMERPEEKR